MAYRAEYLWIDGSEPTREIRSKTKILADGAEPGIWGYDGSSTNQATGDNSDVVLKPVFQCPDPIRGGDNILVLCDTYRQSSLVDSRLQEIDPENLLHACVRYRYSSIC